MEQRNYVERRPSPMMEAALQYAAEGFAVFPLQPRGKTPLLSKQQGGNGCKDATTDPAQIKAWWKRSPRANIGIATGAASGIFVLDVDLPDGPASLEKLEKLAMERDGNEIESVVVQTGGGGQQIYFRSPDFEVKNSASQIAPGLDIRGSGGYVVAPPSIHPSGEAYYGEVFREGIAEAPDWFLDLICKPESHRKKAGGRNDGVAVCSDRIPEGGRNDGLARFAGYLRNKGLDEDAILAELQKRNLEVCDPPLDGEEVSGIARSICNYPPGSGTSLSSESNPERLSDTGNAQRFVERYRRDLRYCTPRKTWMYWTGKLWKEDRIQKVMKLAKQIPLDIFEEAEVERDEEASKELRKFALKSEGLGSLVGLLRLAEPELPVLPERFDVAPSLLNLENGTLDLFTGVFRPHRRGDLLTKICPVAFDPEATAPRWNGFLDTVTGGDKDLEGFLQRVAGYTLTGDTGERCIFLLHGRGANGKSTFVNVLQTLLGSYAMSTPIETLMVTRGGGVPNDIARLRGARLVSASEGENGQRLAESLVKRLTGRDTIVARFLHQEFFEFTPHFKIFLSTNHKPNIRGVDNGVWDRIRLIPFEVRIPAEQQDKRLEDKLKEELPGILNWALAGLREWKRLGSLAPPQVVDDATQAYRKDMDVLGAFLEEETHADRRGKISSKELYERYEQWADRRGEEILARNVFGKRLKDRGLESKKDSGYPTWRGVALNR